MRDNKTRSSLTVDIMRNVGIRTIDNSCASTGLRVNSLTTVQSLKRLAVMTSYLIVIQFVRQRPTMKIAIRRDCIIHLFSCVHLYIHHVPVMCALQCDAFYSRLYRYSEILQRLFYFKQRKCSPQSFLPISLKRHGILTHNLIYLEEEESAMI